MEADELLRIAAEACDNLGLTYLVTGSIASIAYGEPRFTNDIDIVIDLGADEVDAFCNAFDEEEFYLNRNGSLRGTGRISVQHYSSDVGSEDRLLRLDAK